MSYVYKCTGWEKRAEVDNFETGCDGHSRTIHFENIQPISASSMPELIRRIGNHFGLELDDVWIGAIDSGSIGFNRLEVGNSFPPSPREMEEWKQGKRTLYLCDYTFFVEKHAQPVPLTMEDFEGVKTHE